MAVRVDPPGAATTAEAIVGWLASHQQPDGNLYDPIARGALPADHYGTMLFAAACTLARDPGAVGDHAERAVRYFLSLPRVARGAHELNNLGLLCVLRRWRESDIQPELQRTISAYLRRMPFESVTSTATNNWEAMRAVCLAQRGHLLGSAADLRASRECLYARVLPLQGSDGLFADYPAVDGPGGRATPLTYHAKICAMLAMLLQSLQDDAARTALARGVNALAGLCAPNGETTYFGRGSNSLYGYAAAAYALSHALALGVIADEVRGTVAQAARRMAGFLAGLRSPDGRMRLYPTALDAEQRAWDDYVHRLDYNAFCAFMLLQAHERYELPDAPRNPARRFDAPDAGLIVRDREGVFAAFSTRGQFNTGSYLFMDARYSGMQPLTLQCDGRTIVPPPPHDARAPTDPRWSGFMPVISVAGETYAVRVYDEVRVIDDDDFVALVGRGTPVALRMGLRRRLTKATREKAGWQGRALARWIAPLVVRLPVRIPPAYAAVPASDTRVRRAIILLPGCRCLCVVDRVDGRFDAAWSTLRLPGRCRPGAPDTVHGEPEGHVWAKCPPGDLETRPVFTSNGPACVIRAPLVPGTARASAVCFDPGVIVAADSRGTDTVLLTVQLGRVTRRLRVDLDALQVANA